MTLSIRLEGFPNEVDRMIKLLQSNPALVEVSRVSRGYGTRDGATIRRYLEIQFNTDAELGITKHIPLLDAVGAAEVDDNG